MRRTPTNPPDSDRRAGHRRSVLDRRMTVRDGSPIRRCQLRRLTDVLDQPVVTSSSARRPRRRSINTWIEGGLGQARGLTKPGER
jgi:hypothetical protein